MRELTQTRLQKGKDIKETQTLARRLNNATAQMNKTQNALNSTTQRIKALEEAAKRASSRIRIMGERMNSIGGKMRSVGSSVAMTSGIAFGALALSFVMLFRSALTLKSK
ncbi:hypothetical protein [Bacillus velezensis]|uniref:hypothetical protein n=1 Tax=Bacillus velezensis TaxID=492670 RepID=UPI001E301724|nr:hypothetical protein [Bacillus velezensis]